MPRLLRDLQKITLIFEKNGAKLKKEVFFVKKQKGKTRAQELQPRVCPAGQRDDIPRHLQMPCPDEESLEEEYRWRKEHIQ